MIAANSLPYDWEDELVTLPGVPPGPRALVAENDPRLRNQIVSLLAAEGLFVTEVMTSKELLQAATSSVSRLTEPFNLIVADLPMPDGGGIETLDLVRKAGCQGPAIVITCSIDATGSAELVRLHAEHLTKPFANESLRVLASRVRTAYDAARDLDACRH